MDRYDEALAKARAGKTLEEIFPEMNESEDERIRKLLVWQVHRNIEDETNDLAQSVYDGIKGHDPDLEESIEDWKKCLAYLEKQKEQPTNEEMLRTLRTEYEKGVADTIAKYEQKEQKPAIKLVFPRFRVGDIIRNVHDECDKTTKRISYVGEHGYNFDYRHLGDKAGGGSFGFCYEDYYELVEQKPAEWSEEDEKIMNEISIIMGGGKVTSGTYLSEYVAWLKSLPERFNLQPKQEWSEEDERKLKLCEDSFLVPQTRQHLIQQGLTPGDMVSWLKSLRPQPNTVPVEAAIKFGGREYERGVNDGKQSEKTRQWKPSEEQMEALKDAVKLYKDTHFEIFHERIVSLYEQLKKLM